MPRSSNNRRAIPSGVPPAKLIWTCVRAFLIGLVFLLVDLPRVAPANAQANSQSSVQPTTLRFERISTEQGLSQSTVTAILQDRQGFMWFATEGGLNRYDGYQFTVYQHDPDNAQSLDSNAVYALFEDHNGALWIGTAAGLDRFNPAASTFTHYAHDANAPTSLGGAFVNSICEDHDGTPPTSLAPFQNDVGGTLWIGMDSGGLDRFDPSTGTFTHYRHAASDPASLSNDSVNAVYEDHERALWIGTDAGLDRYDRATGTFAHYRQSPVDVTTVGDYTVLTIREHGGALWFGTRSGLVQLDRSTGHLAEYRNKPGDASTLASDAVAYVYEDGGGTLWLGGRSGLDRLEDGQNRFVHYRYDSNDPTSLSSDYVRSVYQDRSGVLWIGTSGGGLSKSSPAAQKFSLYQSYPGQSNRLSDNNVWAVHQDSQGTLWIGTFFAGLNALDLKSGTVTIHQHDPNNPASLLSNEVRIIAEDSAGNVWIGTEHGGLDRLDRSTGSFVHYRHDANDPRSLADSDVFAIYEDREHRLWIGTQNGGLDRLNAADGTFTHYVHDENDPGSLSQDHVNSIYEDNQGELWVSTLGGLDRWDSGRDRFEHYRNDPNNPASLSNDLVTGVLQDANGAFWVGTFGGGLDRFDRARQTFTHYTVKNGLPDDTVYGILADAHGFLWLSTNKGLSRFDPRSGTFRNYTASDGLQGYQFNPRAFSKGPDGEMFFGGTQGLNAFYPDAVHDSAYVPPVVITALTKLNRPVAADLGGSAPVQLSYQDNVVSFEFAALDYNSPGRNLYAYKLEGVDQDWVPAGTRRYAAYTNLSGGDYVFWVKATNSDGVWGQAQALLKVQVAPPFWETWWFRGALALVLLAGVVGAYRMRVHGLQMRRQELESQVERRTRELAALNAIAGSVSRSLDLQEVLRDALEQTMRVVEMEVGSALTIDDASQDMILMAYRGTSSTNPQLGARWPLANALVGKEIDGSSPASLAPFQKDAGGSSPASLAPFQKDAGGTHPLVWNVASDYADGPLKANLVSPTSLKPLIDVGGVREGVQLVVGVPLMAKEKRVGMLVLNTRTARVLTSEELSLLAAIGQQVGVAVENARLYKQAQQVAATAERSRLARELHDSVTQSLYSVMLFAEASVRSLANQEIAEASDYMKELRDTAQEALREMRLLIFELRPPALEKQGLVGALHMRLNAVEGRGGMKSELHVGDDRRAEQLPMVMQEELYQIVREALNNVIRHAHAQRVQVGIAFAENAIQLQVTDDGIGFVPVSADESSGLGLRGMRERVQRIGGTLDIASENGKGTCVTVQVPYTQTAGALPAGGDP